MTKNALSGFIALVKCSCEQIFIVPLYIFALILSSGMILFVFIQALIDDA